MKLGIMDLHLTTDDKLYIGIDDPQDYEKYYAEIGIDRVKGLIKALTELATALEEQILNKKKARLDDLKAQVVSLQEEIKVLEN